MSEESACIVPLKWLAGIMHVDLSTMIRRIRKSNMPIEKKAFGAEVAEEFSFGQRMLFTTVEVADAYTVFAKDPELVKKEIRKVAKDPRYPFHR
jgi:hypothetical protein